MNQNIIEKLQNINHVYLNTSSFMPGIKVCTAFFNRSLIPGINRSGGGVAKMDFNHALFHVNQSRPFSRESITPFFKSKKSLFCPFSLVLQVHGNNAQNTKKLRFFLILVPYTIEKN